MKGNSSNCVLITKLLLFIFLFVSFLPSTIALYADQVGQYDWIKQQVGLVKFAKASPATNLLFVATESNVVAALSTKDGSLVWRKVLDESDTVSLLTTAPDATAVLTVSSGNHLRVFEADGALRWETFLAETEDGEVDVAVAAAGGAPLVITASAGQVQAYNLRSGKNAWSTAIASSTHTVLSVHVNDASNTVTVVGLDTQASSFVVARLKSLDGTVVGSTNTGTVPKLSQAVALADAAVILSTEASSLCSIAVGGGSSNSPDSGSTTKPTCQRLSSLLPSDSTNMKTAALSKGDCGQHVVVRAGKDAAVLKHSGGGQLTVAKTLSQASTVSGCMLTEQGVPTVSVATQTSLGLATFVYNLQDDKKSFRATSADLKTVTINGDLLHPIFVQPLSIAASTTGSSSTSSSNSVGILVQLEEGSLSYIVNHAVGAGVAQLQPQWTRHEALASTTDLLFTDLPAPSAEIEAMWAAQQPLFSQVLHIQLLTLKSHFGLATPEEREAVRKHVALTSDKLRPTRDADGFRRQLIVTTPLGKVMSLHSGDGHVMWEVDFGEAHAPQKLVTWRVPHDAQHDGELAAIHIEAGGVGVVATVLDTRTGEVMKTYRVDAKDGGGGDDVDVVALPQPAHDGLADQWVYAVVVSSPNDNTSKSGGGSNNKNNKVFVLPDTALAVKAFNEQAADTGYWKVDEASGTLRGYLLSATTDDNSSKGSSNNNKPAGLVETWSVVVAPPSSGAKILSVSVSDPSEAVYSYGRPLPNGTVRLKHLSPNTIAVVTGAQHQGQLTSPGSIPLTVWVLDGVSGKVLATDRHKDGCGPVTSLVSEHWVAYHYWNPKNKQWQVSVIELYRATGEDLNVLDIVRGTAVNKTMSAWEDVPIEVARQSFLLRLPAAALAATKTRLGVTAKQLLIASPSGQVYMMDKRLLDPRRPLVAPNSKPSKEQIAEGLPVYQAELPLMGPAFVTLHYEIARLQSVVCSPAVLESTTLMAVRGLDIFFNRLSPSRGYDMVPDDFPAALLVVMMVCMVVAVAVMRVVLKAKAVKLKWQ